MCGRTKIDHPEQPCFKPLNYREPETDWIAIVVLIVALLCVGVFVYLAKNPQ